MHGRQQHWCACRPIKSINHPSEGDVWPAYRPQTGCNYTDLQASGPGLALAAIDTSCRVCPAGMLSLFTKALQSQSSVRATALSTTSNILCSGIASAVLFRERLAVRWLIGATCLIVGSVLITSATRSEPSASTQRKAE